MNKHISINEISERQNDPSSEFFIEEHFIKKKTNLIKHNCDVLTELKRARIGKLVF